jgi:hypothetical protein
MTVAAALPSNRFRPRKLKNSEHFGILLDSGLCAWDPVNPTRRKQTMRINQLGKTRRPYSFRPRLEVLEGRTLLTTVTVDRLTDNDPSHGGEGGNGMGDLRWCIVQSVSGGGRA